MAIDRDPLGGAFGGLVERRLGFLGAASDYARCRGVLIGAPMDFTVTFRPGARLAPQRVREASDVLEEYSLALDADLSEHPFCDLGDVRLAWGNVAASLEAIEAVVARVVADGKVPLLVGGEHLVTWPAVRAVARRHPDLAVLHFDAHADLRADYLGERLSHATAMRLVAEELPRGRVYQFGIRSATREEVAFARDHTHFHPGRVLEPLRECLPHLQGRPLYVTVDIDVLDPAYAPGTGTPEAGGISSGELLEAIYALRGCRVVGFDLVEISPGLDPTERTVVLGAKILREAILSFI